MPNVTRAPSLAVGHWSQVWLRDISPKMLSAVSFSPRGVWTGDDVETLRLLPDGETVCGLRAIGRRPRPQTSAWPARLPAVPPGRDNHLLSRSQKDP